ncbi:hypothetical protein PVAP13_2NG570660 [Panicum virgatum]|uniref:Uncharacterized protein n=1 Tax=Panicum virgatum TaxID=38727 RepID=A0A8T0W0H0_PANVG|nr:hypothetical protein PVAP13_2NG570660 [Panicum virgatum]
MADAAAQSRAEAGGPTPDAADDFEFCILSSGGLVPAGKAAETDMCVAGELFCQGKLLPLRPSSAAAADGASVVTLPRSESAASTVGLVSRSGSRSASSSGSSKRGASAGASRPRAPSSEHGGAPAPPPRRSLSSSLFYAHPSPSPQLRSARPRRSTGSAPPPAAWGLFRLGVAKIAATASRGGGSRSARFEQVTAAVDKKLGLVGLLGDSLGCKFSPDAVDPACLPEAAKRRRKKGRREERPGRSS